MNKFEEIKTRREWEQLALEHFDTKCRRKA